MQEMTISHFKATCLAVLERVRKTGQPLLITKRGVPVAQVLPPPPVHKGTASAFGCLKDRVVAIGDLVAPLPEEDWEALE